MTENSVGAGTAAADVAREDTEPLVIVSCDSHIGPTLGQMRPYCPAEWLDEYDAFSADIGEQFDIWADMRRSMKELLSPEEAAALEHAIDRNHNTDGHFDMDARRRDMDADGITVDVIYHSSQNGQPIPFIVGGSLFYNPTKGDVERAAVGISIYNRWLADACSTDPLRHVGVVHLPAWDLDATLDEVRRGAAAGMRAVNLPTPRPGIEVYDHPQWEPLWATCADLEVTINTHVGGAGEDQTYLGPQAQAMLYIDRSGWMARRALPRMLFGGVFERYPNLRMAMTEQGGDWWTATMREYDSAYVSQDWLLKDHMPKRPSEYCATNVYVGGSFMARFEAELAVRDGYITNMMWGTDYPHAEGTYQYPDSPDEPNMTRVALQHTFSVLDPEHRRMVLRDNPIRCYGLDLDPLRTIADRIDAPSVSDLDSPPEWIPELTASLAFRTIGPWG